MKRATITLSDDLETELDAYLARQDAPPSLTAIVQAALRSYLEGKQGPHGPEGAPYPIGVAGGISEVAESTDLGRAWTDRPGAAPPPGPWWRDPGWMPAARPPRLEELSAVLHGLPRLSDAEVDDLAHDLARGRAALEAAQRDTALDPWNEASDAASPDPRDPHPRDRRR